MLLCSAGYREGAFLPVQGETERQVIIPHHRETSDFADRIGLLLSLVMTKNAIGRGKHLKIVRTSCWLLAAGWPLL